MSKANNGANLGFERELWQAADALRSNMDAAEYIKNQKPPEPDDDFKVT